MRAIAIGVLSAVLAASNALAQDAALDARAEGDAMIAAAGASGLFENITKAGPDEAIMLRHKESGLTCMFNPGSGFEKRLTIFPAARPGDDVGCNAQTTFDSRSFYAVRARGRTLQQILDGAAEALVSRQPDAKLLPADEAAARSNNGITIMPATEALPANKTQRYATAKTYEQVSAAIVNGWEITMRFSGPLVQGSVVGGLMTWELQLHELLDPTLATRERPRTSKP